MRIINALRRMNEYGTIIIAIVAFFVSPHIIRKADPTASAFDAGYLQIAIVTIITFCILQAFTWYVMKIVWKPIRSYMENEFENDFKTLSKCQKVYVSLSVYFLLLFALVMLTIAVV